MFQLLSWFFVLKDVQLLTGTSHAGAFTLPDGLSDRHKTCD